MNDKRSRQETRAGSLQAYLLITITVFLWAVGVVIARAVH